MDVNPAVAGGVEVWQSKVTVRVACGENGQHQQLVVSRSREDGLMGNNVVVSGGLVAAAVL